MTEKEILVEISRITGDARNVGEAVERIEACLALEVGSALIRLKPPGAGAALFRDSPISRFMESREFPFRGLYIAPLAVRGKDAGTLVACFGSWGSRGEFLHRATAHSGEQLAALLIRTYSGAVAKVEAA
jgi:hypothetical protein